MKPRLAWRLLAHAALLAACALTLFPIYAVVVMALSRAPGFSGVTAPDWGSLTLDHVREFVSTRTPDGRWLFGRQLVNSIVVTYFIGLFLGAAV